MAQKKQHNNDAVVFLSQAKRDQHTTLGIITRWQTDPILRQIQKQIKPMKIIVFVCFFYFIFRRWINARELYRSCISKFNCLSTNYKLWNTIPSTRVHSMNFLSPVTYCTFIFSPFTFCPKKKNQCARALRFFSHSYI